MMKMNNEVNQQIDNTFDQMKAEISQQVMTELASKGIDIIENDYDAGAEVAKLINSYNATIEGIETQINANNEQYKESVARVKNYELHLDKQDLKRETLDKLDSILEKQKIAYEQQIKDKQNNPLYKEAKTEAFSVLNLLKECEIPTNKLMEILSPLVEASDTKALEIAQILLQKNNMASYAIDSAIKGINDMATNGDLVTMVNTMRDYVTTGNDGLSYFMYMNRYK